MNLKQLSLVISSFCLFTACCGGDIYSPIFFSIKGIPQQSYMMLEGVRNHTVVGKDTIWWSRLYQQSSDTSLKFFTFSKGLDMSRDTSTFYLRYKNHQGKMQVDTLSLAYQRKIGNYEPPTLLCGGGGALPTYDSLREIYSSAKSPTAFHLNKR
jgi:hypothetical protein